MIAMDKESRLASAISEILSRGLALSDSTLEFMEVTFGEASPEILMAVSRDQENCEKDALLELVFFPDESCRIQLEDFLIKARITDPERVVQHLEHMIGHVEIRFPHDTGTVDVVFTRNLAEKFVSRLRVWKHPDPELEQAVRENVQPEQIGPILVRLRDADFPASSHVIRFFCRFFAKMDTRERDFLQDVDFLLRFSSTLHGTLDIFKALMERKRRCLEAIEKAMAYEKELRMHNMEVMILKGARNPCISVTEAERIVTIINRIALALFGRSDDPKDFHQQVDLGACRDGDDLKRVVRLLS
ncbi:MAG: hypothetical protein C4522_21990 [Desulfobacteraceae bacterium]|nr:MAG: hypothetical protein C4522_21990 [Desulfobacteraceae bacterium]